MSAAATPYRIAVLCYLYDAHGRVLMLHRLRDPNAGMYSPIGGKLETAEGEGPHQCALREIREEAGITLRDEEIRLVGIVSERGYPASSGTAATDRSAAAPSGAPVRQTHWLIFLFEVVRPIGHDEIAEYDFDEGTMEWVSVADVERLAIPDTDRTVMWPSVQSHRGGFFMAHIDCTASPFSWRIVESVGRRDQPLAYP